MKSRRKFIKSSVQASAGILFLQYLAACKSGNPEMVKTAEEAVIKELTLNPNAPYQMQYLRGDVGYFTERGGTIGWMASPEGVVIIDTQFPEQSGHLAEELQKINNKPFDLVINTHHHGDHSSGNSMLAGVSNRILAHENSKKNQEKVATERNQEVVLPDDVFQTMREEKIGNEMLKLYYFGPGHTDGDAITHFENSNIVHMGDLVFNRRFPYIDKSAGAMIGNWISVLDKTLSTFDSETQYIFGHSGENHDIIGNAEDIKAFQNYLTQLLKLGETSIASGKSLDELKAEVKTIPGAPEWSGDGIERSLDAVYAELQG